ncbi:MAG: TonB-dependent receptor [Candidatus Marinimicrobia bacterium]|nr:TonB-dependent receptor [Candidatus Neomarinimicrobiota bacterium]
MRPYKLLSILFLISLNLMGQVSVSGYVRGGDEEALIGANVSVKNTVLGAACDVNGYYNINIPVGMGTGETVTLTAAYIGYKSQSVSLTLPTSGAVNQDFALEIDVIGFESVVIVGYGTQKRGDLSTAITSVKGEDVIDQPVANLDLALQGRASGVSVASSSGQPGAAVKILIRGATSITASSEPLYVVDGIPMTSDNNSALFTGGYNFNSMSDINPDDIESIDILKDASASAIYGARGANGVVQITTKRGAESGKGSIVFDRYTGRQSPAHIIPMMSSKQFIEMMNEAAENDGLPAEYFSSTGPTWNRIGDISDPDLNNTNWYNEVLRADAPIENTSLSVRGGNENLKYFVNGSHFDQAGIQKGTNYNRLSFRTNLDARVNDKLNIGTNAFVSKSDAMSTVGDNSLYGVMINTLAADPTMPVFEDDGNYSNPFHYYSWWALENPVAAVDLYKRNTITNRFLGTVFGEYDIAENFTFKSSYSVDYSYLKDVLHYPSNAAESWQSGVSGIGVFANSENLTWITENMLTYKNTFDNKHNLNLLLVYTTQNASNDVASISAQNYSNDNLGALDLAADITDASTMGTSWGIESLVSRVNYNLDYTYYLTASIRRDGSSRFGADRQYGIFPSFSAAWRVTKEPFMSGFDFLSDMKLRYSYGKTGNQDGINNFASRALWTVDPDYNGSAGISPNRMGNAELEWETTTQNNFGFDASFLDNRFTVTFDTYQKLTTGLLLDSSVPGFTGFTTVTRNIGEVKNSGTEFSVRSFNMDTGDFTWTTTFNISTINNEITKLEQDDELAVGGTNILKEGYPLGAFHLIHWEGVDPLTGNSTYTDVNGDGVINSGDMLPIKDKTPWPDYFGGIGNSFSWKGFDLNIFFQFSKGNYIFNHSRYAQEQVGWSFNYGGFFIPYGNNTERVATERWQNPGDVTDIPRASLGYEFDEDGNVVSALQPNWMEDCDQWLEDASYMRLKTFELGYTVPLSYAERLGLSSLRLYLLGQNLWTRTGYLGVDPEVSSNGENITRIGEDYGGLGQPRTIYFGINVGI